MADKLPSTESEIASFLAAEEAFERTVGVEARQASWEFSLTGDPAAQSKPQWRPFQTAPSGTPPH